MTWHTKGKPVERILPMAKATLANRLPAYTARDNHIKCAECGRFLSAEEMTNGTARFEYTPLSEFTRELCEWICARCVSDTRPKDGDAASMDACRPSMDVNAAAPLASSAVPKANAQPSVILNFKRSYK